MRIIAIRMRAVIPREIALFAFPNVRQCLKMTFDYLRLCKSKPVLISRTKQNWSSVMVFFL